MLDCNTAFLLWFGVKLNSAGVLLYRFARQPFEEKIRKVGELLQLTRKVKAQRLREDAPDYRVPRSASPPWTEIRNESEVWAAFSLHETARLIADCKSTKQIVDTLGVSIKTIETHRSNVFAKLQVHSVAELVRYALRVGLVEF